MTPKENVIPSAIKWMTKLAATTTHPHPANQSIWHGISRKGKTCLCLSDIIFSKWPPSGAKLTSSSSSSTHPCPVRSLSLTLHDVASVIGKQKRIPQTIIDDLPSYRFQSLFWENNKLFANRHCQNIGNNSPITQPRILISPFLRSNRIYTLCCS